MGVPGGRYGVLGKGSVAFRTEEIDAAIFVAEGRFNQHPLANPGFADACANADDPARRIDTLDAGEGEWRAAPTFALGLGKAAGPARFGGAFDRRRIPADPAVDIGIVDPGRRDLDQDRARAGTRHWQVGAVFQFVKPAKAGQHDAAHRFRRLECHASGDNCDLSQAKCSAAMPR